MALSSKYHQQGASMVEMALVIALFLALVFAIFEFSLAVFFAARLTEATRAGARYAIVNDAALENIKDKSCDELESEQTDNGYMACTNATCEKLYSEVKRLLPEPQVTIDNLKVRYQCANTGYTKTAGFDAEREIYSVTVKLQGVHYPLVIPAILTLNDDAEFDSSLFIITMPSFETTRLSEDLWSPED